MHIRLIVLLVWLITAGCGGPKSKTNSEDVHQRLAAAPVGLLVERVIEGELLGLKLGEPSGLAVDFRDHLYVCDVANDRVIRFGSEFRPVADSRGTGSTEGGLNQPTFLTIDNSLNLIVSDAGHSRLLWFDQNLHFVDDLSLHDEADPLKYGRPSGIAVTSFGELWVADWERHQVAIFNNTGQFQNTVGDFGYAGGQLTQPEKILARQSRDGFLVCDAGNARLVYYDQYGNFVSDLRSPHFEYPIAAVETRNQALWVLDGATGQVSWMSPRGELGFQTGPTLPGNTDALVKPSDIVMTSDGKLLISDTGNNRIVICRPFFEE